MSVYNYTFHNPPNLRDPDGRFPNCLTGLFAAGAGAVVQGGGEIAGQLYQSGGDWSRVEWGKVGRDSAYGTGKGALIGATGGIGRALFAGGVGGGLETLIKGQVEGESLSAEDVVTGVASGAFEGALGGGVLMKALGARGAGEFAEMLKTVSGTEAGKALVARLGRELTATKGAALSNKTAEGFVIAIELIIDDQRDQQSRDAEQLKERQQRTGER